MKITGILPKNKIPNRDDQLITMEISFGNDFTDKPLTRKEFVDRLRDEAKKHPRSFLKQMMEHFAEHIEAAAAFDPQGHALSGQANLRFFNSYGGQGSCTGCTDSVSPPTCCSCTHDDTTSCEPC
jgi:hypothetical protein